MTDGYTLSQLCKATGLAPRTVQFWTSNGVVEADPKTLHGGPGVPRQYSYIEAQIAAILAEINKFHLQVGALKFLGTYLRRIFAVKQDYNFTGAAEALDYTKKARRERSERVKQGEAPEISPDELTRIHCWASFLTAEELRADAYLIIRIHDDGSCDADIASDDFGGPVTVSDILGHSISSFVMALGPTLYDLRAALRG